MIDERPRILAIDDTPANLLLLGRALATEFDVQIATSGAEGLALATESPPNLILLDVMMPGLDGFETCQRLKAVPALREIPVIFVTALNELESEAKGLSCGAADYILKPIHVGITIQRIRNLLEREQLRQVVARQRDELAARVQVLQRHEDWMSERNRMIEQLLACPDREQAYQIIAQSAAALFAGHAGLLAASDQADPSQLQVVARWGEPPASMPDRFPADPSWTPRLGLGAELGDEINDEITDGTTQANARHPCDQLSQGSANAALEVPLSLGGQTYGLLHLDLANALDATHCQSLCSLCLSIGESIKLALANLRLREELREAAIRDLLTGLFNRRYLNETLPRELHRCRREAKPLAAAMLDLDHFKRFNDHYGHDAGDAVLQRVGGLLKHYLRAEDLACRYGGEELTLILPNATADEAKRRLERIRQDIMALRIVHQDGELPAITVSIGIAATEAGQLDATKLLSQADAALYRAKAGGRNRVVMA